jgi:hypothetical protein
VVLRVVLKGCSANVSHRTTGEIGSVAPYILKFLPLLLEPSYQSLRKNILDNLHKLVAFLELKVIKTSFILFAVSTCENELQRSNII